MNPKMLAIDIANFLKITVQAVHKQIKNKNLPCKKSQNKTYFTYATSKQLLKLQFAPKVIAVQIVKGGTGKTTLTQSIAIRANLYGAKVLCIDLDQQSNLTQSFQINPEKTPVMVDILNDNLNLKDAILPVFEGLDIIPGRIENAVLDNTIMLKRLPLDRVYKEKIDILVRNEKYDLVLIDCPPALGQSVTAITLSSDYIILPVIPEKFSLSGLKVTSQEIENITKTYNKSISYRIILNKFDGRTVLSHEILSLLIKHPIYGSKLFKSYVRVNQDFSNIIAKETSIFDYLKNSAAKEDIDLLTREILNIDADLQKHMKISI